MNEKTRKQMVLAMETVMRSLNDEDIFEGWLMCGVADGDLDEDSTWEDVDDDYIKDGDFTDLMNLFCRKMKTATAKAIEYYDNWNYSCWIGDKRSEADVHTQIIKRYSRLPRFCKDFWGC